MLSYSRHKSLAVMLAAVLASAAFAAPASAADRELSPVSIPPDEGVFAPTQEYQATPPGQGNPQPYASVCRSSIDFPHISGTTPYTINVHYDGVCRLPPTAHSVEGSLSRSRWYGWEHLASARDSRPRLKIRVVTPKSCKPGEIYDYRGNGRFYALVNGRSWAVSNYNQTPSPIKCVARPGAPS